MRPFVGYNRALASVAFGELYLGEDQLVEESANQFLLEM